MTDTTPPSNAAVASDGTDHRVLMDILARTGGKWAVLVVRALSGGPYRFNQLRRLMIANSRAAA